LQRCWHTFADSESGWGLDRVWPMYLKGRRMGVVDSVQARHARPIVSRQWQLESGMTPHQEMDIVVAKHQALASGTNPLETFFRANAGGRRIHKWTHYFDVYHEHFAKFRDRPITFVEIGVQYGGSLRMWRDYFGEGARIIGVDVEPACEKLREPGIEVFIGDQADRSFLETLRDQVGSIDILLDDGGHTMQQQINSFDVLYPAVGENGIYAVEDTHTSYWSDYGGGFRKAGSFMELTKRLIDQLNAWHAEGGGEFAVDEFTRTTQSMHFYDSMVILQKGRREPPRAEMVGVPGFSVP
jgi:cephalosporin hydroxylase